MADDKHDTEDRPDAPPSDAPVAEDDAPDAPVAEDDAPDAPVAEDDAPPSDAPVAEDDAPPSDAPVAEDDAPDAPVADGEDGPLDLDNRVLCADGNCIGVVGADGRCKECGKPYDGELPPAPAPVAKPAAPSGDEEGSEGADEPAAANPPAASPPRPAPPRPSAGTDWNDRVLCSDGNCIGIIGPDGRCKECGKPYEGEPA